MHLFLGHYQGGVAVLPELEGQGVRLRLCSGENQRLLPPVKNVVQDDGHPESKARSRKKPTDVIAFVVGLA
jgi:hypothetical protein